MARLSLALLLVAVAACAVYAKDTSYGGGYAEYVDDDGSYGSGGPGAPPGTFIETCDIEFDANVESCPDKFKLDHIRSYVNEAAEELLAGVGTTNIAKVKSGVLDCAAATDLANTTISLVLKIKAGKGDADAIEELLEDINGENLCDGDLVEACSEYDISSIICGDELTKVPKGVVLKGTSPEYKKYVSGRYGDGEYGSGSGSYGESDDEEEEYSGPSGSKKAGKGAKPGKHGYGGTGYGSSSYGSGSKAKQQ